MEVDLNKAKVIPGARGSPTANTPITVRLGDTPVMVDRRGACRLHSVTFSGCRAGGSLEPTEALERDVSTFQDAFINLPLILQATEVPGSPI